MDFVKLWFEVKVMQQCNATTNTMWRVSVQVSIIAYVNFKLYFSKNVKSYVTNLKRKILQFQVLGVANFPKRKRSLHNFWIFLSLNAVQKFYNDHLYLIFTKTLRFKMQIKFGFRVLTRIQIRDNPCNSKLIGDMISSFFVVASKLQFRLTLAVADDFCLLQKQLWDFIISIKTICCQISLSVKGTVSELWKIKVIPKSKWIWRIVWKTAL